MPVTKALRFEILRRDRHTCTYCGAKAPDVRLHVDHVIPESLGGSDKPHNLTTACEACNSGKAGRMIDETTIDPVDQRAVKWAAAMRQAIAERHADQRTIERVGASFLAEWEAWEPTPELPGDYAISVTNFLRYGLDWDTIIELVHVTMNYPARDKFRYFCGCCRRRIDDIQQRALEILEEGEHA